MSTLREIEARAAAATPGPWTMDEGSYIVFRGDDMICADLYTGVDADFIAHARTDIPTLLAMVRAQALKLDSVRMLADDMSTFPDLVPAKAMAGLIKSAMEARK